MQKKKLLNVDKIKVNFKCLENIDRKIVLCFVTILNVLIILLFVVACDIVKFLTL